jgi:hypothetical protein
MPLEDQPDEPEIRYVNPKDLRLGPIRRGSLSAVQLEHLRAIYEVISPYQTMAFETMELTFLRDANPDKEIAIWAKVAVALSRFIEEQPQTTHAERKSILSCLLLISMGSKRPENIDQRLVGISQIALLNRVR